MANSEPGSRRGQEASPGTPAAVLAGPDGRSAPPATIPRRSFRIRVIRVAAPERLHPDAMTRYPVERGPFDVMVSWHG